MPAPPPFEPWVGCGCSARPIPIDSIKQSLDGLSKAERGSLAFDEPELRVGGAPTRASTLVGSGGDLQQGMWGCFASKRICRATMPGSLAAALDGIVHLMHGWVGSLGADVVKKAESLVCFRGGHPVTGCRRDIIALLVFSRKQPSIQFYAMCDIKGASPDVTLEAMPDGLPFVASIRVVPSRLSSNSDSVDIRSNEEIAQDMVSSHMEWCILPLQWRLPDGASPLLDHVVVQVGARFEPRTKIARCRVIEIDDVFDQLSHIDPIAAGVCEAADASSVGSGASPSGHGAPPGGQISLGGESAAEAELFDGFDLDLLDDLQHELFGEPLDLSELGASPDDAIDIGAVHELDEPALEQDVGGEAATAEEGASPSALVEDAIKHCKVSDSGYVTCSLEPWSAHRTLGRITTWPKDKDKQLRSISCKCYLHPKCSSAAKKVKVCSEETLLRWLLSGHLPDSDASSDRKKAWGKAHAAAFAGTLAKDASSSSAAVVG